MTDIRDLMPDISHMTPEQLATLIREIRTNRRGPVSDMSAEKKATKAKAKAKPTSEEAQLKALFKNMTPEKMAALKAAMEEQNK